VVDVSLNKKAERARLDPAERGTQQPRVADLHVRADRPASDLEELLEGQLCHRPSWSTASANRSSSPSISAPRDASASRARM